MEDMKFNIGNMITGFAEVALNEIMYEGRSLAEWIDDISHGKYVPARQPRGELNVKEIEEEENDQ